MVSLYCCVVVVDDMLTVLLLLLLLASLSQGQEASRVATMLRQLRACSCIMWSTLKVRDQ